jgi:3-methyladenine DNA glycosylase AlkD
MTYQEDFDTIRKELAGFSSEEKKAFLPHFFKTGKGEYGEGDKFMGVVVPNIRIVAKRHLDASVSTAEALLSSEWHEERMCALLILVTQFAKADEKRRKAIYQFYLAHTWSINNWDLVDLSAPNIVGAYLKDKGEIDRKVLMKLSESTCLWEQRIAIVSTITFIRNREFDYTLRLARRYLHHPHDLMQKATGWMLREIGKRDEDVLRSFLDEYATEMPRTMLRYAIEKFDESTRQLYLKMR